MTTKPNDRAFQNNQDGDQYDGLTKREYFAAMAMQGILACPKNLQMPDGKTDSMTGQAVIFADTLISALNEKDPK